ncbi:hypothetical protein AB0D78_06285 [Streptomyces avermitilis]|uniref:SCO4225 family membrane protein n=1 Tax=Streptomyces avermitilis TaxID=33903 RepID=UPI0033E40EA2
MNISRRSRALLAPAGDNWLSRVYLAVVVAATGFVLYDAAFVSHPDASLAGVVPWLLTAPLSLLYTLLPDAMFSDAPTGVSMAFYLAGIAVAALANAVFMGVALRRIRPSAPRTAPSA